MIGLDEALRLVLAETRPLPEETISLEAAPGAVLAGDLAAPQDLPRFDQSAMDGFAVRMLDVAGSSPSVPRRLRLAGAVAAGDAATEPLPPGRACRVFTGSAIPEGADAVVMQEHCVWDEERVDVFRAVARGEHIRRRGEEFAAGDRMLPRGTVLTPAGIGLLASIGADRVAIHRGPTVTVLATGNELAAPGEPLTATAIRDSNSPALAAALKEVGVRDLAFAKARDDRDAMARALTAALGRRDVIVSTGGVSVGEHDLVKEVSEELGVRTVLWRVAIKPGKPNYFGVFEKDGARTLVFGLPGNPVSALVSFVLLVRPALLALRGREDLSPRIVSGTLLEECRKKAGRAEWVRGRVEFGPDGVLATPFEARGSHLLSGLALANALIELPLESERVEAGETVRVLPLPWTR